MSFRSGDAAQRTIFFPPPSSLFPLPAIAARLQRTRRDCAIAGNISRIAARILHTLLLLPVAANRFGLTAAFAVISSCAGPRKKKCKTVGSEAGVLSCRGTMVTPSLPSLGFPGFAACSPAPSICRDGGLGNSPRICRPGRPYLASHAARSWGCCASHRLFATVLCPLANRDRRSIRQTDSLQEPSAKTRLPRARRTAALSILQASFPPSIHTHPR